MHRLSIWLYVQLASIQIVLKSRSGPSRQIMYHIARINQCRKSQITDQLLRKIEFDTSFLGRLGIIFPTAL